MEKVVEMRIERVGMLTYFSQMKLVLQGNSACCTVSVFFC